MPDDTVPSGEVLPATQPTASPPATAGKASVPSLFKRARVKAVAGLTALLLAMGGGLGEGAVLIAHDSAAHVVAGGESGAKPSGQTCERAVLQIAALAKSDPEIAREYGEHVPGLPALVDDETALRCHSDFTHLFDYLDNRS